MNPLTPERLAEIEKRCNAATAGPWWIAQSGYNCTGPRAVSHHNATVEETQPLPIYSERNMDFIANSITDIPDLLSEIKRLREEVSNGHEAVFTINEALAAAKSNGQLWEEDMVGLCKHFGVEITVDNIDNAADQVIEIHDQLRAQLSDAQAALRVKDEALVRLSEQRGTLLGVATTFKQTVFLGEDRPLKQEQRERLLQNLAEIIKDCSDNTATAAPQPGRE
jgi:hypothetical protein